jgi:hypothetical protein
MKPVAARASRLGLWLSLLALVFASGSQWTLLQGVAWARMIVVYAQEGTLAEALAQTFSGRRPCPLCHQAQKGQHQQGDQVPWQRPAAALELIPTGPAAAALAPDFPLLWQVGVAREQPVGQRRSPPKPPPRSSGTAG